MIDPRRRALAALALLLAACSLRFDELADEVTLIGAPAPLADFPAVHRGEYARDVLLVRGALGVPYAVIRREGRAVPLGTPARPALIINGDLNIEDGRLYRSEAAGEAGGLAVTVRRLGEGGGGERFTFPLAGRLLLGRDAFAVWPAAQGCVDLVRFLEGGASRQRRVCGLTGGPIGFDATGEVLLSGDGQGRVFAYRGEPPERVALGVCLSFVPRFDSTGRWFQCQTPEGFVAVYDLVTHRRTEIGLFPRFTLAGDVPARGLLLLCGAAGLYVASYADGSSRALTRGACEAVMGRSDDAVLYRAPQDSALYRVPLDGSEAPRAVLDQQSARVLAACDDRLAYAPRPALGPGGPGGPDGDGSGGGEGLIDGERFMERGVDVSFGRGCRRLRWRGDVSYGGQLGTLLSSPLPLDKPLRLGIQSRWYHELPGGKVAATTNMDGDSLFMVIDEERREAYPLLSGAEELTQLVLPVPELGAVLVQRWLFPKDYSLHLLRLPRQGR